ncbi:AAA family ATPase [Xanthomonas graminis]|uniref:ATPase n=1 Tax=Xanthomonas graminis pv. phlei TaxID=487906 RepID=A0A0K3A6Z9_9XANT|nr:ATP-binding protein [Xanthomonas translucens]UKE65444.1 ATP-binding protein [Xanthomonas translucens pv. phlei]CTP93022.1 ATPase [Xanthomonas translucens pv. phlei]
MSTAEQLKALLLSHKDGNDERFYAVALQWAAQEARKGHLKAAEEIKQLVDAGKAKPSKTFALHQPRGDLGALLSVTYPRNRLSDLITGAGLRAQLERIIREQRSASSLLSHGLSPRRKLLLVGPPGTGKTLSASVLAGELGVPLFLIRLDVLITKFMGETAARLRQVFDAIAATRGVYFFDEFDAIGSQRGGANDVGEVRRILNSFLQMLEQDQSHSLVVAATNHPGILDYALLRRFDDVLNYGLPDEKQIRDLLKGRLLRFMPARPPWKALTKCAEGLSYAEITKAAEDAIKEALIRGDKVVDSKHVAEMLAERQVMKTVWKQFA